MATLEEEMKTARMHMYFGWPLIVLLVGWMFFYGFAKQSIPLLVITVFVIVLSVQLGQTHREYTRMKHERHNADRSRPTP